MWSSRGRGGTTAVGSSGGGAAERSSRGGVIASLEKRREGVDVGTTVMQPQCRGEEEKVEKRRDSVALYYRARRQSLWRRAWCHVSCHVDQPASESLSSSS